MIQNTCTLTPFYKKTPFVKKMKKNEFEPSNGEKNYKCLGSPKDIGF
jgi:hypothetical protein